MRVFFINSVCLHGSTGKIFRDLMRLLAERGDEALFAFGRGPSPEDIPHVRIGGQADFLSHVLFTRLTDRQGHASRSATKKLIRSIEAFRPDVVHLGNIHGYYLHTPLLMEALGKLGIPVLWTLHDCWAFTGHCSHFTDVGCKKYMTGCFDCPKRGVYPNSWLFDRSKEIYAEKKRLFSSLPNLTLAAPSRWLSDRLAESFLSDIPRYVLPNGVDLGIFRPRESDFRAKYGLIGKKIALGVATPWDARKGLYDCVALSQMLPEDWVVALVALTERQIRALPNNMLGLPRIDSPAELAGVYSAADVYINPTYCDTFPTTNIEALACGTPVVTYDVGGSPESLDLLCGTAVAMGDVDALARAVVAAPERFTKDACLHRAGQFERDARLLPYLAIYDTLTGGGA